MHATQNCASPKSYAVTGDEALYYNDFHETVPRFTLDGRIKPLKFQPILLNLAFEVRIPADPDSVSGSIRTLNRKHPDTLSSDLILR